MTIVAHIALLGWLPAVACLFVLLPPRRAVTVAFVGGWMLLPMAEYPLKGLPDYSKITATCLAPLVGAAVFDTARLVCWRPKAIDVPMMIWCLCPLASAFSNRLPMYDGVSGVMYQGIIWGVPYLLGRIYFVDPPGLRGLAVALFVGGLLCAPLCLVEMRLSPQLHRWIYGYHQHSFAQTYRMGGWRPTIFMQHGLMVALWMSVASLAGLSLWMSGSVRRLGGAAMGPLVAVVLAVTLLCRSLGAITLLAVGAAALLAARHLRWRAAMLCLLLAPGLYMVARLAGVLETAQAVAMARRFVNQDRADSLMTRLANEDLLSAKAMQRPVLGWSGWGRSRVYDDEGNDISVTDGHWIIVLGSHGLLGLAAVTSCMLLPACLFYARVPVHAWTSPRVIPLFAIALVQAIYTLDCIPNAMINPVYMLGAGGLASTMLAGPHFSPTSRLSAAARDRLPHASAVPA